MDASTYLSLIEVSWYASIAAQLALVLRLLHLDLIRVYPRWATFLISSCVFSFCLAALGTHSPSYRTVWGYSALMGGLLLCSAIWEVLAILWAQYPYTDGLQLRTKAGMVALVVFLATGALQTSEHFPYSDPMAGSVVCAAVFMRKYVYLASALLLVGAWNYFRAVRPMLTKNIQRHGLLLSMYCAIAAALAWSFSAQLDQRMINLALSTLTTLLYVAWGFALRADGQERLAFLPEEQAAIALKRRAEFLNDVRVLFAGIRSRVRG